jgi:hypothetical protein
LGLRLPKDEVEVSAVDQQARSLADDEDRVSAVNGVAQEYGTSSHTQEPESGGDDALPAPLRGDPLYEEAGGEQSLTAKPIMIHKVVSCTG